MKTVLGLAYASHSTIYAIGVNGTIPDIRTNFFINKLKTYLPDILSQLPADQANDNEPNIYNIFITTDDANWQMNGGVTNLQFETLPSQVLKPSYLYQPIDHNSIVEYLQKDVLNMIASYQNDDASQMQTFIQDAKSLLYQDATGQMQSTLKIVYADGLRSLIAQYRAMGNQVAQ